MLNEVKVCVDTRVTYFDAYLIVPNELQGMVDEFTQDVNSLGEACQSTSEFESKFVSSGLSDRFLLIIQKCTQKPRKMTKEEKKNSIEITKNILKENKKEIAQDMASDVATTITTELRSEMATRRREKMIADGTYADNTIRKNTLDNIVGMGRLFKSFFDK